MRMWKEGKRKGVEGWESWLWGIVKLRGMGRVRGVRGRGRGIPASGEEAGGGLGPGGRRGAGGRRPARGRGGGVGARGHHTAAAGAGLRAEPPPRRLPHCLQVDWRFGFLVATTTKITPPCFSRGRVQKYSSGHSLHNSAGVHPPPLPRTALPPRSGEWERRGAAAGRRAGDVFRRGIDADRLAARCSAAAATGRGMGMASSRRAPSTPAPACAPPGRGGGASLAPPPTPNLIRSATTHLPLDSDRSGRALRG